MYIHTYMLAPKRTHLLTHTYTHHREMYGTSDLPMGLFTLQWLEEKGRPIALLEAGKLVPQQLVKFLESRPQLAWIYYAMEGNLC